MYQLLELEVIIALVLSAITALIIFLFGNRNKKYDEYPFLSGESLRVGKVQYPVKWLYYVFVFIALDVAVVIVAILSPSITLVVAGYLALISLVLLFIPSQK